MIILIDNYDSFSYNLYQMMGAMVQDMKVIRNDAMTVEELEALHLDAIVISPGPGKPEDAGICVQVVQKLGIKIPILGVCLGHQAICIAFGATVSYAKKMMHGKQSIATVDRDSPLFTGCEEEMKVARYHSLAVVEDTLPECLKVTARAEDGEIMAIQHSIYPIYGVQFHPESIMTPDGKQILENFLSKYCDDTRVKRSCVSCSHEKV
ncbi:MAG: aminodeoxychorismate/anthranilate synthase component II [Lachnospiraceae bacterium]|nr:aminodeoxychorismate/anthranilate synthase component II [Lachnospiraceae bacterium]